MKKYYIPVIMESNINHNIEQNTVRENLYDSNATFSSIQRKILKTSIFIVPLLVLGGFFVNREAALLDFFICSVFLKYIVFALLTIISNYLLTIKVTQTL